MHVTNSINASDTIIELDDKKLSSDSTDREETKVLKSKPKEKDEKMQDLQKIFARINKDLENEKYWTLDEMYNVYVNSEDISKREIKDCFSKCSRINLCFMLYVVVLIFGIINLIAIFESITMLNIISQISINSFFAYIKSLRKDPNDITKFSINDFNYNYNFYFLFFEDIKKEAFDFNLMMFFGFIGVILLKATGYRVSTIICLIINGAALTLIYIFSFYDYDIIYNTFQILKLMAIFSFWLLLSIGVGASALLSQHIIVYINDKYNEKVDELNEETIKSIQKKRDDYENKKSSNNKERKNKNSKKKRIEKPGKIKIKGLILFS